MLALKFANKIVQHLGKAFAKETICIFILETINFNCVLPKISVFFLQRHRNCQTQLYLYILYTILTTAHWTYIE